MPSRPSPAMSLMISTGKMACSYQAAMLGRMVLSTKDRTLSRMASSSRLKRESMLSRSEDSFMVFSRSLRGWDLDGCQRRGAGSGGVCLGVVGGHNGMAQHVQAVAEQFGANDQGRQQPDHIAVCAADQDQDPLPVAGGRHLGGKIGARFQSVLVREFDGEHGAAAAELRNDGRAVHEGLQDLPGGRLDSLGVCQERAV